MTTSVEWVPGVLKAIAEWPIFASVQGRVSDRGLDDAAVMTISTRRTHEGGLDVAAATSMSVLSELVYRSPTTAPRAAVVFYAQSNWAANSVMARRADPWHDMAPGSIRSVDKVIIDEYCAERDGEHRRAALALVGLRDLPVLAPWLRRSSASFILLLDRDMPFPSAREVFRWGLGGDGEETRLAWASLVPECLERSILPVFITGNFDDQCANVDLFTSGIIEFGAPS